MVEAAKRVARSEVVISVVCAAKSYPVWNSDAIQVGGHSAGVIALLLAVLQLSGQHGQHIYSLSYFRLFVLGLMHVRSVCAALCRAGLAWPGISDYGEDMMTGRIVITTGIGPEPKVPCASRRTGPRP